MKVDGSKSKLGIKLHTRPSLIGSKERSLARKLQRLNFQFSCLHGTSHFMLLNTNDAA
jgi:hypothetical protein